MQQVPVLALDIEGFTQLQRTLPHRRAILGRLEELMVRSARFFIPHGSPLSILAYQGTGDGCYLVFQHYSFHIALKYTLDLAAALVAYNRGESDEAMRIRLRLVLAVGDVETVGGQYLADVFSEAARFLDHPPFKGYLKERGTDSVLALTALFYSEWQRCPDRLEAGLSVQLPDFTPFQLTDKHGLVHAGWVAGAGWQEPPAEKQPARRRASTTAKPWRVVMLIGHSLAEPLPEAVDMFRSAAAEWRKAGLAVEVRLDLATLANLQREAQRGWDLLIFYGHGNEKGQLRLADQSWMEAGMLEAAQWRALKLALIFACHGQTFAAQLPAPWIAFTAPILRRAPWGFTTAWIRALGHGTVAEATRRTLAEIAPHTTGLVERFAHHRLPNSRLPQGEAILRRLSAALEPETWIHQEFSAPQRVEFRAGDDPFVGRQGILEALMRIPIPVGDGPRQRALWVHGDAGMGKSALLRHFTTLAADLFFFEREEPLHILHIRCASMTRVADLQEYLYQRLATLCGQEIADHPEGLCRSLARVKGRHLWVLDDITYMESSTEEQPVQEFLQRLLRAARAAALPLQLVVSSRRAPSAALLGDPVWSVQRLEPLSSESALQLAQRLAHPNGGSLSPPEEQGARRIFGYLQGATGLYRRALVLAIDQKAGYALYADRLERFALEMDAPGDPVSLARQMIAFELEQLDALTHRVGFDFRDFLSLCHPLMLRAGRFRAEQLQAWFGERFRLAGVSKHVQRLYQEGLEQLRRLAFLGSQDGEVYFMPPNQRLSLESIQDPQASLPDAIPWDGIQERLAHAMEYAQRGDVAGGLVVFAAMERDYARYQTQTPQAAVAVFRAMRVQAEVADRSGDFQTAIDLYGRVWTDYGHLPPTANPDDASLVAEVATVLFNKGVTLGGLNRPEEEIAAYDTLLKLCHDRHETAILEPMTNALFNKGNTLDRLNRPEEAIAAYDILLNLCHDRRETAILEPMAQALVNKGVVLGRLNRPEEEIAAYDILLNLCHDRHETAILKPMANALFNKGAALGSLNRPEEAIVAYDTLLKLCHDRHEPAILEHVAKALLNKGIALGSLNRPEEAIAAYDILLNLCHDRHETAILKQVAGTLLNKGATLGSLNRPEEAIAAYDTLLTLCHNRHEPAILERVAGALINKGITLAALGRPEEEIAVYDTLLARFHSHTEPAIAEIVAVAQANKQAREAFLNHSGRGLRRVVINGFKSIAAADIALNDLNVIIGANGAGKSNLIEIFRLLERLLSKKLQGYAKGEPERFFHHGKKMTATVSLAFVFDHYAYGCTLDATQSTLFFEEEWVKYNGHPEDVVDRIGTGHPESKLEEAAGSSRSSIPKHIFQKMHKPILYHFHDTSDSAAARNFCPVDDNRFFRTDAANLPAYLYWLQHKHPLPFRRIEEHIRLVAPFFDGFILAPSRLNEALIKLEWRQKDSEAYFDAHALSDGTLRFICLATALLQPEPPALMVFDEPELGLHPFALHILAEMLKGASLHAQVVLATQSVTLLNHFTAREVIVVENDGMKTTFQRLDEASLKEWLEEFSLGELWEKNILGGRP
ncbi:MAG: AAA family ATPase [Magnetococcales bacterium]|nr:AAA family ATPase [Magnetococcales bacterium]